MYERKKSRESLLEFTKLMFKSRKGYEFEVNHHHVKICDALMRVFTGECKRLIINIPPRYSKTEIAVINFIAWCFGKVPDCEFIHASYSSSLAVNNSSQIRGVLQNDAYNAVFPETKLETEAQHHWKTTAGGVMYAAGAGGTITGYGAGKQREGFGGAIVLDDLHKADEATSNVIRQGVLDWFQNTIESRKNNIDTPIIVIMQRLHENDVAGWLLNGGNGEQWEHLCLPAIQSDGTALWSLKHTIEKLQEMQKASAYVFAGQYMQNPSPLGGGLIKGDWFKRYTVLPIFEERNIFADTAMKTASHNDYSVLQCWGKSEGRIYLIDQLRGKWESTELKARTLDFWAKHSDENVKTHGHLRMLYIEDKASGTGLIQDIAKAGKIPVKDIQRHKDKLTRLMDVQGYIESGLLSIPPSSPWVNDFISECEAFTPNDTHAHDDQIDPMCDAINTMLAKRKGGIFNV